MRTALIVVALACANYPRGWQNVKHAARWVKHEAVCVGHGKLKCK